MTGQKTDTIFDQLTVIFAGAVVFARLCISSQLLAYFDIPYNYPGGSPLVKFHPGTYLTFMAFMTHCLSSRSVLSSAHQFKRFVDVWAFVLITLFIALLNFARFGPSGAAFYIDTLIAPGLLAVALLNISEKSRARMFHFVIIFLLMNALLGIGETLLKQRLIPFTIGGQIEVKAYFRATAFLGHPLKNSYLTALALPFAIFVSPNRLLSVVTIFVFLAAFLAFGGRLALVVASGALVMLTVAATVRSLLSGRFTDRQGILLILGAFTIPAFFVALMLWSDLGVRIIERFFWDESAQARLSTFDVLSYMTDEQIFFGVPLDHIGFLMDYALSGEPVENSWVLLLMQMGLIAFVPFICSFLLFIWRFWRLVGPEGKIAVLMFLLFVSTGPTLGTKSGSLSMLVILLVCSAAVPAGRGSQIFRQRGKGVGWSMVGNSQRGATAVNPRQWH